VSGNYPVAYTLISIVYKSIDFNKYGWTTPAKPPLLYYDSAQKSPLFFSGAVPVVGESPHGLTVAGSCMVVSLIYCKYDIHGIFGQPDIRPIYKVGYQISGAGQILSQDSNV
jgi:hypothetical protein